MNSSKSYRFHKTLLINPPHSGLLGAGFEPDISLGYLSQYLSHRGIGHEVVDMAVGYDETALFGKIETMRPDLIGLTVVSLDYLDTLALIGRIKKRSGAKIVVGGPHVSCLRQELFFQCPDIDFGVVMEGERTLAKLIQGNPLDEIRGLLFKKDGKAYFSGEPEIRKDLDRIPFPRYEKFELKKYLKRHIGIITSRGCPYHCIYCPVPLTIGNRVRFRSAENILSEIRYWYDLGYRNIDIWDDNFTLKYDRVARLCDQITQSAFAGLTLNLPNGIRADRVDRKLLRKMKAAGFKKIAFGVEGGNDRILRRLNKGESMAAIEKAISLACDMDFDVILFFLIGAPGETMADLEDSFALAQKYPVAGANFYNLIPFPRTPLFDWVSQNNFLVKPPEQYMSATSQFADEPCFATPDFTLSQRKEAFHRARKISDQIKRRWVEKKFRKLGPLARGMAFIYAREELWSFLTRNRKIFRFVEILKHHLLRIRSEDANHEI